MPIFALGRELIKIKEAGKWHARAATLKFQFSVFYINSVYGFLNYSRVCFPWHSDGLLRLRPF